MSISIIVPVFQESSNTLLLESLQNLRSFSRTYVEKVEILLCGELDETSSIAAEIKAQADEHIVFQTNSRAARMNHAAKRAQFDILLFHHPRSKLEGNIFSSFLNPMDWGAFTHRFVMTSSMHSPLAFLKFTSWYSNKIRGDLKKIYYLDHCLFVKRSLFTQVGGFEEVDIFEDTLLCLKLRKISSPIRLSQLSLTSPIRFETNGFLRQALHNQWLKLKFFFRFDLNVMNKRYEENTQLNSKYSQKRSCKKKTENP